MACCLVGTKPLPESILEFNFTLSNKCQWNVHRNWYIFIQENACENVVCETVAILSWPQCVKSVATRLLLAWLQKKLEQLEHLRSEDTPRRLMITHTIESYRIPSQNENIGQGQRSLHTTRPLMLMMICAKYGKNASRIVDFFSRWKPKN